MCVVSYPFSCAGLSTKRELLTVSQALRSTPSVSRGALHRPWRPGTKTGMQVLCCSAVVGCMFLTFTSQIHNPYVFEKFMSAE